MTNMRIYQKTIFLCNVCRKFDSFSLINYLKVKRQKKTSQALLWMCDYFDDIVC